MPRRLVIRSGESYLDGGTVVLHTSDENDRPHRIEVPRQYYAGTPAEPDEPIPGRLYYDRMLVEVRSAMEKELIELLRAAPISPHRFEDPGFAGGRDRRDEMLQQPDDSLAALVREVVSFVQSDHYVRSARPS